MLRPEIEKVARLIQAFLLMLLVMLMLAIAWPALVRAASVTLHPVVPWPAIPPGSEYVPRLELAAPPSVVAQAGSSGELPNLQAAHWGWEASDGWFCQAGEIYGAGTIYEIPNPQSIPSGHWGAPSCRSMTIGPEGAHWFTDPGSHSVGRVVGNTVSEYPIPALPAAVQGYPGIAYPIPAAIATVGGDLWVAFSDCKCVASVNAAASAARHHRRRR